MPWQRKPWIAVIQPAVEMMNLYASFYVIPVESVDHGARPAGRLRQQSAARLYGQSPRYEIVECTVQKLRFDGPIVRHRRTGKRPPAARRAHPGGLRFGLGLLH